MSIQRDCQTADVTVVVPVYNEAAYLETGLAQLCQVLAEDPKRSYELIVVEDGSTDGSLACLEQLAARLPFRLLLNPMNMGYGASLKRGLRASQAPVVAIIDADGTYPCHKLPRLCELLADTDMVVGARRVDRVSPSWPRRLAKGLLTKLANFLTGARIPDVNSGLRVMRRQVVEQFIGLCPNGFSFTTTITLALLTNDYAVRFEPVDYYPRQGVSKIRPVRDLFNFLLLIIRTVMYFRPLQVFVPISLIILLMAGAKIFYDATGKLTWDPEKANISDSAVLLSCVFMILMAIGALGDLIAKRLK